MKQKDSNGAAIGSGKARKPICGVTSIILLGFSIILIFAAGPNRGGQIDVNLRGLLPVVGVALAVAALVRRERMIWWAIGIVLTVFYVGLHSIAIP